jgi:hypothetical protein
MKKTARSAEIVKYIFHSLVFSQKKAPRRAEKIKRYLPLEVFSEIMKKAARSGETMKKAARSRETNHVHDA